LDRSLDDRCYYFEDIHDSRLKVLERLATGGFFKNNRQMIVYFNWKSIPRLFRVLRCMNNLETLSLLDWELTLTEDVPQFLQSCPKLTALRIRLLEIEKLEMNNDLKNELRSGFQRLQLLELKWDTDSWPVIQDIFT
jgi:hypothetical protein